MPESIENTIALLNGEVDWIVAVYTVPGEVSIFSLGSNAVPEIPEATLPHPHTFKLGEFITHSTLYGKIGLDKFLKTGFSRVSEESSTKEPPNFEPDGSISSTATPPNLLAIMVSYIFYHLHNILHRLAMRYIEIEM